MGERTPHLDPIAKGVFFGLSAIHTKTDMLRAVMEGVTYSLKDCMEIIAEMGVSSTNVRASGGGGKSPLWKQMQSDVFNTPVETLSLSEGGALGVALLAGVGTGVYKSVPEACDAVLSVKSSLSPIKENTELYNKYYNIYTKLYPALKEQYKAINDILN